MGIALAVIAAIVVLLVILVIVKAVRIVQQGFVGVVTRFGEFKEIRQPGLTFIVPIIENLRAVDVRETPRTGDRQQVITRDNVAVIVNATIFSQVVDVRLALFTNSDYLVSVDNLARTSLRAVFGSISLDDAFSQREKIGTLLQTQMEEAT
ncbi:MAG TPA: SPFH domain-containing protein, partial [Acidimicrobiales bacterium]|nr:SPFH domain-containing protein [Acidimicrobiales bacterium]